MKNPISSLNVAAFPGRRFRLGTIVLAMLATVAVAAVWVEGHFEYQSDTWIYEWIEAHWTDPVEVPESTETQWVDGYYENQWVDGYMDQQWVDGYYEEQWIDGYWSDEWVDGYWDTAWVDGHWEDEWVDGYEEDQWVDGYWDDDGNWQDGYWETVWVDGYWNSNWVDGYSEDVWVDGHTETVWVDGYPENVWVDGYWEDVWVEGYTESVWVDGYWETVTIPGYTEPPVWLDGYWGWTVVPGEYWWNPGHWEGEWVWTSFDEVGEWYSTAAWSPDPSTVPSGQTFTQTCPAARDHRIGERNEAGDERNVSSYVESGGTLSQLAVGTGTGGGGGGGGGSPPVVTGGTANGTVGVSFSYGVSATNSPSSYDASGLPGGLTLNPASGVIGGVPTETGVSNVSLTASNAVGTGTATLVITITVGGSAPVVTGGSASGTVGVDFSYQITATDSPASYAASGLPGGLTLNETTGQIGGTPSQAGSFAVALVASNAAGSSEAATLDLTIEAGGGNPTAVPAITSSATAVGAVGAAFSYAIVASNSPVSYAAAGLPSGLALDVTTGLISGVAMSQGDFNVTLTATNAIGTSAPKTLTISVLPADTSPPIAPVSLGLAIGALSSTGFGVTWIPYTDNAGMAAGYPSFGITYVASLVNTAHVVTTSSPAARFNNLTPGATYTVRIMARDLSGNETGWNSQTYAVTLPTSDPVGTGSTWADVNGDGLPDELIAEGGASYDFNSFPAETSHEFVSTITFNYPTYFWFGIATPETDRSWTYFLSGLWQPLIEFGSYEVDLVRPGYQFRAEPGYEYSVVSKLTLQSGATAYATLVPRTEFVPASALASAIQQEVLLGSMIPVDMLNYSPLSLARISKPLGYISVAGITTGSLGTTMGTGGIIDVLLPSGGAIINVSDLANQIIKAGPQVVVDIWDAINNIHIGSSTTTLGGILNTANLGITTSGQWHLGFRFGETTMAWITLRAVAPVLEPITLAGGVPPFNPSGFELGGTRSFRVTFGTFAGVSDNDVTWTATPGVSFVGGNNKGKTVQVQGTAPGVSTLEVTINGFGGPKPTVTTHIFSPVAAAPFNTTTVKISPYVVRNDSGGSPAISASRIASLIAYANTVFKQAGIVFTMAPIVNVDIGSYLDISAGPVVDGEPQYHEALQLTSLDYGTGGLEIYFVNTFDSGIAGLAIAGGPNPNASGIILSSLSSQLDKTFAHELGHACGWPDIYVTRKKPDGSVDADLPTDKVKQAWLPADWNNGPDARYYDNIQQRGLVEKLLMHGHGLPGFEGSIAIPRGAIYGLSKTLGAAPINLNVGLNTMTRNPVHP